MPHEDARRSIPRDTGRVIDVISRGYSAGGNSNNSKKLYAREICRVETKRPQKNPSPVISFSDDFFPENIIEGHQDALVITTRIGTNNVKKVLIDNGSSVDILYYSAYSRMDLGDRKLDNSRSNPMYGFTGNEVKVIGTIDLPVLFGSPPCQSWQIVKFLVINTTSSYNAILGRTTIAALKTITSITHLKMKFPTEFGIGEVCGDQRDSRQCYLSNAIPKRHDVSTANIHQVVQVDPRATIEVPKDCRCEPNEALEEIQLFEGNSEKVVKIGANLNPELRGLLIITLRSFADIFAWDPRDIPGISEHVALHRLIIKPGSREVKQKKGYFQWKSKRLLMENLKNSWQPASLSECSSPNGLQIQSW